MVCSSKIPRLVGHFIRQHREAAGLSQRALGLLFNPPVTTQFISNVERGVTPLPPSHIQTLTKALQIQPEELMSLLEKEYAAKLTGRVNHSLHPDPNSVNQTISTTNSPAAQLASILVEKEHHDFLIRLCRAYKNADPKTKQEFMTLCESFIKNPNKP